MILGDKMLKHRLIPNIILNNGDIVQSVNFEHPNIIGNAVTAVDFFNSWAVDEIIILDVSRDNLQREKFHKIIHGLSKRCFIPLTVGGWITNTNEIQNILSEGADKISINTEAFRNPDFIKEATSIFGSQCIVVAIDAKRNNNSWSVFTHGGRVLTELDAIEWAEKVNSLGAGELLITSMDEDGQQKGYDIDLLKSIQKKVNIPIIASGGAGNLKHMLEALTIGKSDAVLAASIFHYGKYSIKEVKDYLNSENVPIRLI